MSLKYREDKATQAAARLLALAGGKMNYMKLIKLLYLAERKALLGLGRPIVFDAYFSLPHGPVLSFTLNIARDQPDPEKIGYWQTYISPSENYDVRLLRNDVPRDALSEAEEALLETVFEEFGHMDQWELRDYSHTLPEWQDPEGSSHRITVQEILRASGLDDHDITEIVEGLEAEEAARQVLD